MGSACELRKRGGGRGAQLCSNELYRSDRPPYRTAVANE